MARVENPIASIEVNFVNLGVHSTQVLRQSCKKGADGPLQQQDTFASELFESLA
jgi:hypothetical protein